MMELGGGQFLNGDCLELMRDLPDGSVDMVLCDLPYGTVKGMALDGWSNQRTDWDDTIDTKSLFEEYNRVLRANGACVLFAQEPYTSHIITNAHNNVPFSYRMIWKKDHFANALLAKKAPVSYYEDICVFFKNWDTTLSNPLRAYSKQVLEATGMSLKEVNSALGHRRAEHFLYWDTMQFSMATKATYEELELLCGNPEWWKPYEEVKAIDGSEKSRWARVFNLPEGKKYLSNVLEFKKEYEGRHPTQKPVALFEYLIRTYTNPGEVVLDNTAGSGTTAIAAENSGRKWICMERDPDYYASAVSRVWDHLAA